MHIAVGGAAVAVGFGIFGAQLDSFVEVEHGHIRLAHFGVSHSSVVVGFGIIGLQLDGLCQVGDGVLEIAFHPVRSPSVLVKAGLLRLGGKESAVFLDRLVGVQLPGVIFVRLCALGV